MAIPGIHILGETTPDCPLCLKPFKLVKFVRDFYVCEICAIATRTNDKWVGHWEQAAREEQAETREYIRCVNPKCGDHEMRLFCREDGFVKTYCPKCGATISNEDIPYDDKSGTKFIT